MPDKFAMVDLETMDTAATAAIVSIGAVIFDPRDVGEIISEFYAVVSLQDNQKVGRTISAGTVEWWLTQSQEAREALFIDPRSLRDALTEFRVWYNEHQPSRFWANDPDFDGLILAHALRSQDMHVPWHFSATRSVRTIKELAHPEGDFPDFTAGKGTAHNALADAAKQAMQVQYCYARLGC